MSRRARKAALRPPAATAAFAAVPGWRPVGGALCAMIAAMLLVHQLYIDAPRPAIRLVALLAAVLFGAIAWYLVRRGFRRGTAIRVGPEGVGIALGFRGWLEVPWEEVRAWRYWEPTGFMLLIKRRAPRWVGYVLKDESRLGARPWDERLEMWLARANGRPSLCVTHPFVEGSILEVLEAFQTQAGALDDREGKIVR